MYTVKPLINRGHKIPHVTARCPVCRHENVTANSRVEQMACRCGAVLKLDHDPEPVVIDMEALDDGEFEDGKAN